MTSDFSVQRVVLDGYREVGTIGTFFKKQNPTRGPQLDTTNHIYCVRNELAGAMGPSDVLSKGGVHDRCGLRCSVNGGEFFSKHTRASLYFIKISTNSSNIVGASCTLQ